MISVYEEEIVEYLDTKAQELGTRAVERAVQHFLNKKHLRRIGVTPTKRKPVPKAWTLSALRNQGNLCSRCNTSLQPEDASGDHIIPVALGGPHCRENIQALHKNCNSSKGDNDPSTESKKSGRLFTDIIRVIPIG